MDAFRGMLRQNLIKNCEVTDKDIAITDAVFGPDVPTLKGKSTRPKPRKVVGKEIDIPEEFVSTNKDIELAIDIIFINNEPILTTIDRSLMFKACMPLKSREDENILQGLDTILCRYNQGGYTVVRIHADGEFKSLLLQIEDDLDISVNIANPD